MLALLGVEAGSLTDTQDNVLVSNGRAVLCDFGLSRVLDDQHGYTTTPSCTPKWASPEMIRYKFQDQYSDVYSFGCVLLFVSVRPGIVALPPHEPARP